jgi:hypothetical protein
VEHGIHVENDRHTWEGIRRIEREKEKDVGACEKHAAARETLVRQKEKHGGWENGSWIHIRREEEPRVWSSLEYLLLNLKPINSFT